MTSVHICNDLTHLCIQVPGGFCDIGPGNTACPTIPQMVTITFDDAINNNNIDLYNEVWHMAERLLCTWTYNKCNPSV